MLIAGERTTDGGNQIPVSDPFRGEVIGAVSDASSDEISERSMPPLRARGTCPVHPPANVQQSLNGSRIS